MSYNSCGHDGGAALCPLWSQALTAPLPKKRPWLPVAHAITFRLFSLMFKVIHKLDNKQSAAVSPCPRAAQPQKWLCWPSLARLFPWPENAPSQPRGLEGVDEDAAKLEPLCTAGGNVKCCGAVENRLAAPQNTTKNDRMVQPLHFWVYPQNTESRVRLRDVCTPRSQQQRSQRLRHGSSPSVRLMDERISKMWSTRTTAYSSALTRRF